MPFLRKLFFYLFATIYLIICPLLILRLLGFIYIPQQKQFIKTGLIYVSTNPPGASVTINGLQAHENTPTAIRDLLPGNYQIKVELEGYQPWTNTIPVEERKASAIENLLLIPPQWQISTIINENIEDFKPLGDENSLLILKSKAVSDIAILRIIRSLRDEIVVSEESYLVSPLIPAESIYNKAQVIRLFTVEKSPFFVMQILLDEKNKYLWVDTRDKQVHLEDITDLIPQEPSKLWWEANDEKIIYVYLDTQINRIDIKAKAIFPDIASKDIPNKKSPPIKFDNARGIIADENKNLWLIYTKNKIGVCSKELKNINWIFEAGKNIESAYWANNANTIIFKDDQNIYLIDRENIGQIRMQKIVRSIARTPLLYAEKTGKIYFINEKHLLSSVQLLKHKPILPKVIAEKLKLKKK